MLQQTQVSTVIPYYQKFLQRFPNLERLANAETDEVLALWSGLGYYARGRNLHKAAQVIRDSHDGRFPDDLETLTSLPGIGRSTAAAILALTWDQHQTILDGNVKRVLARYHAVPGWPGTSNVQKQLWQLAEAHTPERRCGDYTQAIMDLGATVCRRSQPLCQACPVNTDCQAFRSDTVTNYPEAKPKKARPRRNAHMLVITNKCHQILLEKRPPTGIWGGLWSLPELTELPASLADWSLEHYGIKIEKFQALENVDHSFSHFDLTISPLICHTRGTGERVMDKPSQLWYNAVPTNTGEIGHPSGPQTQPGMATAVKKIITAYQRTLERPNT